jgi:hypothetical protein
VGAGEIWPLMQAAVTCSCSSGRIAKSSLVLAQAHIASLCSEVDLLADFRTS